MDDLMQFPSDPLAPHTSTLPIDSQNAADQIMPEPLELSRPYQPETVSSGDTEDNSDDPLKIARGIYVTIHGHFYQPPRENPYLDAIERQPSAAPAHDWNERIYHECYRPNAFARILNDQGDVRAIVNNFEYLSFNIGPTLMSWLERHDLQTYQRILEADRKSCARLNGHGNAIAQVYNHIIMPLANQRDQYTQIRWGKADFRARFGRDPEGMWLAEAAVDYATLRALVDEGIKFIILAPSQAQRCRPLPTHDNPHPQWHEVGGSQIDPTRPYRCFLETDQQSSSGCNYIDIFFYDGPISRDMGFSDVLGNSQHLAGRFSQAVRGDHRPAQLIAVATDGETFGHHKSGAEKTLAYTFLEEFPKQGWTITNFAHYLSLNSPTWEVELKPVTAWSCSHGVDRWQEDCGCGGGGAWNQQWRRPLRNALDWLRDRLISIYEEQGQTLFRDPWTARDAYIQVVLDRTPETIRSFLSKHSHHKLTAAEQTDALRLLEMQRHTLLMYTSCGWFFEELSRPEGTQILRYAARAVELAGDVAGVPLEKAFIKRLALAPSNVECFKTGAEVYRQLVIPNQVSLEQVTAHYAISSLFSGYPRESQVYCYDIQQFDYQLQRLGTLSLAVGHLQITAETTREVTDLVFAVLHLGGWDFHCCVQAFEGRRHYSTLKAELFNSLHYSSAAYTIGVMNNLLNSRHPAQSQAYNLHTLFAEERHRIMQLLTQETLGRLNHLYTQVYRDNYSVLMAFQRDELEAPHELQVAAEIALAQRVVYTLRILEQELSDLTSEPSHQAQTALKELEAIAAEAERLNCHLDHAGARQTLERLIVRSLDQALCTLTPAKMAPALQCLEQLIQRGNQLKLHLALDQAQELFYHRLPYFVQSLIPVYSSTLVQHSLAARSDDSNFLAEELTVGQMRQLLGLGQQLGLDMNLWLDQLG
jgi:alpha-amylase/alpha-mannosidase (GH57 family)